MFGTMSSTTFRETHNNIFQQPRQGGRKSRYLRAMNRTVRKKEDGPYSGQEKSEITWPKAGGKNGDLRNYDWARKWVVANSSSQKREGNQS